MNGYGRSREGGVVHIVDAPSTYKGHQRARCGATVHQLLRMGGGMTEFSADTSKPAFVGFINNPGGDGLFAPAGRCHNCEAARRR